MQIKLKMPITTNKSLGTASFSNPAPSQPTASFMLY